MAKWLSSVRMLVHWFCECGQEHAVDALTTNTHVCPSCQRKWHINGRLDIGYDDARTKAEPDPAGLWAER